MTEKPTTPPSNEKEPIESVKIEKVNGWRRKIRNLLKRGVIVFGVGGAVSGLSGKAVQDTYRDWVNYHPEQSTDEQVLTQEEIDSIHSKIPKEIKEPKNWKEHAKKSYNEAKEWSKKKINSALEKSKLINKYRETQRELRETYKNLLEAGDKAAFWFPFLLMLLAATLLTNKIIKVKKDWLEPVDEIVEANMKKLEEKLNELIGEFNEQNSPSLEKIQNLMEEYSKNTSSLDESGSEN